MSEHAQAGPTRELRLAVVLYGGVSLAIYMHGTTKELHRLVKASARAGAAPDTPTERVYQQLLEHVADRDPDHVRTRVVVDVIAGTSAGGINGVVLAKALAHNRSQDALRDVWLRNGDIKELLRHRHLGFLRIPFDLAQAPREAPLRGDAMSEWLYGAIKAMDDGPADPGTLMPPGHMLELFVTATDLAGYDRQITIADPGIVHDLAHRHVLRFAHSDDEDDFGRKDDVWLAFAARATSCFPGAFDPVSARGFAETVGASGELDDSDRFFRIYSLSHADQAEDRLFIDGGVLDNRPFDHAIPAIQARPADSEVDRRVLYLEPDPASPAAAAHRPLHAAGPITTVLSAVAGIPRKQPILDQILEVRRHNERVRQLRDIIEMSFETIGARVTQLIGANADPSPEDFARWNAELNDDAKAAPGYSTYLRSKVTTVVARYAATICKLSKYPDDCNQAEFVRAVLHAWARQRLLTDRDGRVAPVDDYADFLRTFDLDYGARRLRFVIDALNWWYSPKPGEPQVPREDLDRAKALLWARRSELIDAMADPDVDTDLTELVRACFGEEPIAGWTGSADDYVVEHADALARLEEEFGKALTRKLEHFGRDLLADIRQATAGWPEQIRRDLLIRYVGFPLWDAILFPVQAVADAGEHDVIEIVRFSPDDVEELRRGIERPPLCGASIGHFGAFFHADGRQRDYLLGRLDGAERLIGLLLGPEAEEERSRFCRLAFAAILEEEGAALPEARDLMDQVRAFAATSEPVAHRDG